MSDLFDSKRQLGAQGSHPSARQSPPHPHALHSLHHSVSQPPSHMQALLGAQHWGAVTPACCRAFYGACDIAPCGLAVCSAAYMPPHSNHATTLRSAAPMCLLLCLTRCWAHNTMGRRNTCAFTQRCQHIAACRSVLSLPSILCCVAALVELNVVCYVLF
jgi:hypothetical protein